MSKTGLALVLVSLLVSACVRTPGPPKSQPTLTPSPTVVSGWVRHADNPLIVPDQSYEDGRYDIIMGDPGVLYDAEAGLWKAWFNATRCKSWADFEQGQVIIKYAESTDGVKWKVQKEPALVSRRTKGDWDYYSAETPDVVIDPKAPPDRRYKMFYSGSEKILTTTGSPNYRLGLAISPDGKHFQRLSAEESPYKTEGMVLHPKDAFPNYAKVDDGVVADPDVVLKDGVFHLWFSSFAFTGSGEPSGHLGFGIGYATSSDGIHWKPAAQNPLPTLVGTKAPTVIWNPKDQKYHLWFTWDEPADLEKIPAIGTFEALGYWHATSPDGQDWTYNMAGQRDFEWDGSQEAEVFGVFTAGEVVQKDDELSLYYIAWGRKKDPGRDLIVPVRPSFNASGIEKGTTGLLLARKKL